MLSWLPRRRARIERIEAEAEALIRDFGEAAYDAARVREHEASSDEIARDWDCVALAVARLIGERHDVDPMAPLAMNAVRLPSREAAAPRKPRSPAGLTRAEDLARVIAAATHPFRIQFVGAAPDLRPVTLKEVEVEVADASAAIVAAANIAWPPRTIGLRILDSAGREVFARQKAGRR
jgi:hypothetical protein